MKVFLAYFLALLLVSLPGEASALPLHAQDKGHHKTDAPAQPNTAAPEPKRAAPSFAFGLEDATPVKLKLSRELSSAREKAGDRVDFEVAEDIKVKKDEVVIPKGGMAWELSSPLKSIAGWVAPANSTLKLKKCVWRMEKEFRCVLIGKPVVLGALES